jgi:hypothetical protein
LVVLTQPLGQLVSPVWHTQAVTPPVVWHVEPPWQTTPLQEQIPAWHASPLLPQTVPFVATGLEHCPVWGLHVPATWHWSLAVHTTPVQGFADVQVPVIPPGGTKHDRLLQQSAVVVQA